MDKYVIETNKLTKKYADFVAVDTLDLTVMRGEVYGLLGPNGAGKTTTILMLLGLTDPTAGTVNVLGFDPTRKPLSVKSRVGYIPDEVGFYDELTARENLIYIAKLNGIPREEANRRIDEALDLVGLFDVADHRVKTFSRGMRQRLGVADVLIKKPKLIIMDEPTQGLDPESAHEFLGIIRDLVKEDTSMLLSSHLLHQVQSVCDRVALFHQGRKVLEGSVEELAREVLGGAYRIRIQVEDPTPSLFEALQNLPGVVNIHKNDHQVYEIEAEHDLRPQAAEAVVNGGHKLLLMDLESQSLDDIYTRYFEEVEHDSKS